MHWRLLLYLRYGRSESMDYVTTLCCILEETVYWQRKDNFFSSRTSRTDLRPTQPSMQRVKGFLPEVKWLGSGVEHLPPPNAEVKN